VSDSTTEPDCANLLERGVSFANEHSRHGLPAPLPGYSDMTYYNFDADANTTPSSGVRRGSHRITLWRGVYLVEDHDDHFRRWHDDQTVNPRTTPARQFRPRAVHRRELCVGSAEGQQACRGQQGAGLFLDTGSSPGVPRWASGQPADVGLTISGQMPDPSSGHPTAAIFREPMRFLLNAVRKPAEPSTCRPGGSGINNSPLHGTYLRTVDRETRICRY